MFDIQEQKPNKPLPFNLSKATIDKLSVHYVGNKSEGGGIKLSDSEIYFDDPKTHDTVADYFVSSFKNLPFYHFYHPTDLKMNDTYFWVCNLFDADGSFHEISVELAHLLYDCSDHPRVKDGEFFVVKFSNCYVGNEEVEAIGLFKTETKDIFLKIKDTDTGFELLAIDGINTHKLDKGCIIFNKEREKGFLVLVLDKTNKIEASYWIDEFIRIKPRNDNYQDTQNYIQLCRDFFEVKLAQEFETNRADQIDFLNKTSKFFKEKENFDVQTFSEEVIKQPDIIDLFNDFKKEYKEKNRIELHDEFEISKPAIKNNKKILKSIIKLDKNFHIYIHGNKEMIEKGFDETRQLHYYKLYFREEN